MNISWASFAWIRYGLLAVFLLVPFSRNVWAQQPSQHVFCVGSDGHVRHFADVPGTSWTVEDLTAETGAVPAIPVLTGFKDDRYDAQQVFYIGTDQHVHHFYGGSGSWGVEDLSASTGAEAAASGLSSFKDTQYNAQQVFYIGTNEHVYHFYAVPGNPWSVEDVTANTGATVAASGLTSFNDVEYNAQQVFYIGTDEHVHHFYDVPGNPWGVEDMSASTGASAAASGLSSFNDVEYNAQQVFYIGTDQHVHHFYAVPGNPWSIEDITASTGATLAAFGLTSFNNEEYNAQQVFYIGTDEHVHHFYDAPGDPWGVEDLSASTGAMAAASGLTSFNDELHNAQQVFYIGTDQHVHHFYAVPGNPWSVEDISASTSAPAAATPALIGWVDSQVTISGQVTFAGAGFSGVGVLLQGTSASGDSIWLDADTGSNGNYSFGVPYGGDYTVTPSLAGYTFSPGSSSFNGITSSQTANFTAARGGASSWDNLGNSGAAANPSKEYIRLNGQVIAIEIP